MKLAFRTSWPLRQTMVFERLFPPQLALPLAEKRDLLRLESAIAVWMYNADTRALIGETYATAARDAFDDDDSEGRNDIEPYLDRRAAYVYSNAILPRYQGRGLGKILKAYFLGRLAEAGYDVAIGHAREGASVALNVAFGARLGRRHPNWFGSGELYRFYRLRLRHPRGHGSSVRVSAATSADVSARL